MCGEGVYVSLLSNYSEFKCNPTSAYSNYVGNAKVCCNVMNMKLAISRI